MAQPKINMPEREPVVRLDQAHAREYISEMLGSLADMAQAAELADLYSYLQLGVRLAERTGSASRPGD